MSSGRPFCLSWRLPDGNLLAIANFSPKSMWAILLGTLLGLGLILYSPLSGFLKLSPLSGGQVLLSVGLACASVLWYEAVKAVQRHRG